MNAMLDDRRRVIVSALCGLGAVCVNALWIFEASSGMLAELDRYGYPFLVTLFVAGLAAILFAPRWRARAEKLVYGGVCLYFLTALFSFTIFQSDNRVYTVANTLQWMPILYVAAFVFFRRGEAMIAAAAVFATSLIPSAVILVVYGIDYWDVTVAALLANAYMAHLLTWLALSVVALLDGEYERVSGVARTMESAAMTDGLTGVANRRGIDQVLHKLAERRADPVGLVMFDVDHFKSVNDRFGHLVGDDLLVSLARQIGAELDDQSMLGRWGGEELLVILIDTDAATAYKLAERIRAEVAATRHPVLGHVTISAGVTMWRTDTPVSDALRLADNALYQAKLLGRDRVEMR